MRVIIFAIFITMIYTIKIESQSETQKEWCLRAKCANAVDYCKQDHLCEKHLDNCIQYLHQAGVPGGKNADKYKKNIGTVKFQFMYEKKRWNIVNFKLLQFSLLKPFIHYDGPNFRYAKRVQFDSMNIDKNIQQLLLKIFLMQAPPPPPQFELKTDSFVQKRLSKLGIFDGSNTQELESKIKRSEDLDPSCFAEAEGANLTQLASMKILKSIRLSVLSVTDVKSGYLIQLGADIRFHILREFQIGCSQEGKIMPTIIKQLDYCVIVQELTERSNVTYILNVSCDSKIYFPDKFIYKHLYIADTLTEKISDYFDECYEFIKECKEKGKNILIHCVMGMSRSATMVLLWLMKGEKMNLKEAFELAKSKRYIVRPNPTFAKELLELELKLFGKNSVQIKDINPMTKLFI